MWLGAVPWAGRHWVLPVLTVLALSSRCYQRQGRRHKKLTDWARQMILQLRRWLPQHPPVVSTALATGSHPASSTGRLFQEVRTHLGMETQRQWSNLAIARTTPALLGLFSWTTLAAHILQQERPITQRTDAWYDKPSPTFVDAIALVRRRLWLASERFSMSAVSTDPQELPASLYHRMVDSLAYAA